MASTGHAFNASSQWLFGAFRLLVDVRVAVFIVAGEVVRGSVPTDIAVDALPVNIILARNVVREFILNECHYRTLTLPFRHLDHTIQSDQCVVFGLVIDDDLVYHNVVRKIVHSPG